MTYREIAVECLPYRCQYCGSDLVSDSVEDFWRVCQQCEVVFIEPMPCEVASS